MITIQVQDLSGNWRDVQCNVTNISAIIITRMRETQNMYPGKRVRAVDNNGRLVDML